MDRLDPELKSLLLGCGGIVNQPSTIEFTLVQQEEDDRPVYLHMSRVLKLEHFPELISPYIEDITSIDVHQLENPGDLAKLFQGFPHTMTNLHSIWIENRRWDGLSEDPSWEFPATMKTLSLEGIPLGLFSKIRTLTKFEITDLKFSDPLDTILTFLKANSSLESVRLILGFKDSIHRCSKGHNPIDLKRLEFLAVGGSCPEDVEALISCICLPENARIRIHFPGGCNGLADVFSCIKHFATSPNNMKLWYMEGKEGMFLSKPSGYIHFYKLFHSRVFSLLEGKSSIERIEGLCLMPKPDKPESLLLYESLFPAPAIN